MDKLELDDRVSRLERRTSLQSLVMAVAMLMVLGMGFLATVRVASYRDARETATIVSPAPPRPPIGFEAELRKASEMQHQGLITQEDLEQKKEMILSEPMTFDDDLEAMKTAKALLSEGVLNQAEFEILKRKILKFGK